MDPKEKDDEDLDEFLSNYDYEDDDESEKKQDKTEEPDTKVLKETLAKSDKIIKDQREKIRQLGEDLKSLLDWKDSITGKSFEKEQAQKELEAKMKFEENGYDTVKELIESKLDTKLSSIQDKINLIDTTVNVNRIIQEISQDYEIDWDKDYIKIIPELEKFDEKMKKEKPKEVLLSACKLAGVIKKKDKSKPPYVEGEGYNSSVVKRTEADKIKKGILNRINKGSDNIFGI